MGDQIPLEPIDRPSKGQLVGLGRADPRIDRPRHQGHAAGLRWIAVFRHQRRGGEDGNAGLADGDDVGPGPHHPQEFNQMVNEGAKIEAARGEGHIANVMPVGDVDVVAGRAFAALTRPASLFLASCVKRVAGAPAQDAAAMARSTSATMASLEQPLLQPMPIATVVLLS